MPRDPFERNVKEIKGIIKLFRNEEAKVFALGLLLLCLILVFFAYMKAEMNMLYYGFFAIAAFAVTGLSILAMLSHLRTREKPENSTSIEVALKHFQDRIDTMVLDAAERIISETEKVKYILESDAGISAPFGGDQFNIIWSQAIMASQNDFRAINYISSNNIDSELFTLGIQCIGAKRKFANKAKARYFAARIFIFDSLEEAAKYKDMMRLHKQLDIKVCWILKDEAIRKLRQANKSIWKDDVEYTFILTDERFFFKFDLENRAVKGIYRGSSPVDRKPLRDAFDTLYQEASEFDERRFSDDPGGPSAPDA